MVECNKVNVRLSDSKSNKLKTAVKNQIGVALRKISKCLMETNKLPQ